MIKVEKAGFIGFLVQIFCVFLQVYYCRDPNFFLSRQDVQSRLLVV